MIHSSPASGAAVLLLLLCLTAALGAPAATDGDTWEHLTVTTTDGARYRDVTVAWGLDGFTLRLTAPDGHLSLVGPLQVTGIVDTTGRDLTEEIAAASPASDVRFALLGERRSTPFRFKLALGAGGTLAAMRGEAGFRWAGAVHAGARVPVCTWSHLHVLVRRQRVVEPLAPGGGDLSANTDELHFLLGSRLTHPRRNSNFSYLEFGLALVRFDRRFDPGSGLLTEDGKWRSGVTLRGGLVFPLGPRFGLDLGAVVMARPGLDWSRADRSHLLGLNLALISTWR